MLVRQSVVIAFFTVCTDAAESISIGSYNVNTRQLHGAIGIMCI